ncbi:type IV toxin-antitoxin system AbiEi family antitoxin domain-containing protein [Pseudoxanthomonas mexicana]
MQTGLPRGAPFGLETLAGLGVDRQSAARQARSGWLVRLGQGVYAFPNDPLDRAMTTVFLQTRLPGLHVAGRTALDLHGVRHNLGVQETWVLWGDGPARLPAWYVERFPAHYVGSRLFNWADESLPAMTVGTPPGVQAGLRVSVPERALLEMLFEVGVHQSLEEARQLFENLRPPRRELLARLLECCTSVKAVRLFLTWARETRLLDVDKLLADYTLPVGSDSRWMTRLKDGTLLSLRPHG